MNDYRAPFDEEILYWINGLNSDALDALFVAASSRTFGVGIGVMLALWLLVTHKRKALRAVVQATTACIITDNLGALVLKPYFGRIRPHLVPDAVVRHFAEAAATGPSLPSLHAATSFAFVVGLGLALPRTMWITAPVAALISISRIAVGVHWPSDVLAGTLYGSLVGLLLHLLFQRFWPRPTPVEEPDTKPGAVAS